MASFRKRGDKWSVSVQVAGVRKSKSFITRAQAKSWAAEMELALEKSVSTGIEPGNRKVVDLFQRYADEVSESKRGARWEIIRLEKFCQSSFAKLDLSDVRREHLEAWIDGRLKSVKSSSVNRELNLISHAFTQGRRWRWMTQNPFDDLQRPKNPPHRDRLVSKPERAAILSMLGYDEEFPVELQRQRVAVAFLFALETAMRAGEICGLHSTDIDIQQRTALLRVTKNGTSRHVPLSTEAIRLLKRLEPWPVTTEPVFRLKSGVLSTFFKKSVTEANIDDLTFHDTRHEAITRLAGKLDVLDLARMVGHRDIKQLMTYYNKTASELARQLG